MANWCNNHLNISCYDDEKSKKEYNYFINYFFEKLSDGKFKKRNTFSFENILKVDKDGSYDNTWGTRSDLFVDETNNFEIRENVIQIYGETRWSPFINIVKEISLGFPNLKIDYTYDECGNDFIGYFSSGKKGMSEKEWAMTDVCIYVSDSEELKERIKCSASIDLIKKAEEQFNNYDIVFYNKKLYSSDQFDEINYNFLEYVKENENCKIEELIEDFFNCSRYNYCEFDIEGENG